MGCIGVIGGLGPEGTVHYYRKLTQRLQALPAATRPGIVVQHLWMDEFAPLLGRDAEVEIAAMFDQARQRLAAAGATVTMVAAVTPHKFLNGSGSGPVLANIVDATLGALQRQRFRRAGLLGTRPTLTEPFFRGRLEQAGIDVVVPPPAEIDWLHELIFGDLARGVRTAAMAARIGEMIATMAADGIDVLVVACTDLMELINTPVPLLDPIDCHIELAISLAGQARGISTV